MLGPKNCASKSLTKDLKKEKRTINNILKRLLSLIITFRSDQNDTWRENNAPGIGSSKIIAETAQVSLGRIGSIGSAFPRDVLQKVLAKQMGQKEGMNRHGYNLQRNTLVKHNT